MNRSITDAELEVMKILWRDSRPKSFAELRAPLQAAKNWDKSTINTLIRRLCEKDALRCTRDGARLYAPNVSEDEYILAEERAALEKFGSAKKLLTAMVRNGHLTDSDLDELRDYFRMGGGGNEL
ncbi:MAG: BlaI/MecI/CopY family transcriptional regulator [Oscillospiraceae bacterium]|jgi:BlaI family penicillinase repressor|nr:BlaI/MecI/CopY family transcriptional regulator [Oscillospiraceae bacterium]